MKKTIKLISISIMIVLFMTSLNISYAGKEELKTPKEKGESSNSFTAAEILEACKYFDTDNNGHISLEEFEEKTENSSDETDKYLTVMNFFTDNYQSKAFESNTGYIKEIVEVDGERQSVVNQELLDAIKEVYNRRREEEGLDEIVDNVWDDALGEREIYKTQPRRESPEDSAQSLDDLINDANSFVGQGNSAQITNGSLQDFSSLIYNIFLTVGIVVAVIVGGIIGIKLMASNIDTKVEAKKLLIPYVVGCVVVFGAFGIWKIVVTILQEI